MNTTRVSLQIATDNPEKLAEFYRSVVELPQQTDMGPFAFDFGPGGSLFIVDHSEVSGRAAEPARVVIDLHVDDIDAEHARLAGAGVKFIREKGVEYWGGVISTFADPDGNILQLITYRPELARPEGEPAAAHA